ncbi:MAG: DUF7309 domain-containing protein [Acidobacteriaceae bacterium]
MERLYGLASDLFALRPWHILDEDNLILARDSVSGELCYCSVMGALGEVLSMHAYIGTEGLRQLRKMETEEIADPGEFLASTHCVYVEFVPRAELLRQDRELLAALGHPRGRGLASPIFRTMRPGFFPWFVTAEEARTLAECIHAVIVVCAAVASQENAEFWERADTYPMVTRMEGAEPQYHVEMFHSVLPPGPPVAPVRLAEETLLAVRAQDYAVRGVMELDITYSGVAIGKKNERNSCASIAIAVDAETGMVLAPEVTDASVPAGDTLARVFLKAIQASRTLPKEVRVRKQELKDSLAPLMESFGVTVRVSSKLPASDEARSHLLGFLDGGFGGR